MHTPTPRHLVLAGAVLVAAVTAAVSSVSLYELAVLCGIPDEWGLPAALPIALDVGATVAALVWITEKDRELRAWGRWIALSALAGTVAGNAVTHAIAAGLLEVTLPLVLAVGAVIPAMLFCVVHLCALMTRPAAAPKPKPAVKPKPTAKPKPKAKPPVEQPADEPQSEEVPDEQGPTVGKRAEGLAWARENWPCSGGAIAMAVGCSRGEGDRIRSMVKQEKEASA